LIKLYVPENEVELMVVKSLLEAAEIPFYVHNEHFGGLYIGPQIQYFNQRMVMVPPEFESAAREVLSDLIKESGQCDPSSAYPETGRSLWQKVRMVIEVLFFFWTVPGPRKNRKDNTSKRDNDR